MALLESDLPDFEHTCVCYTPAMYHGSTDVHLWSVAVTASILDDRPLTMAQTNAAPKPKPTTAVLNLASVGVSTHFCGTLPYS
jgi:hypothetical protein